MVLKVFSLRDFFLRHLEQTFAEAAKTQDPVLILIFAHWDFESPGGFYIGTDSDITDGILSPKMLAEIHTKYPDVRVTLFMTSCYSGHWVETVESRETTIRQFLQLLNNRRPLELLGQIPSGMLVVCFPPLPSPTSYRNPQSCHQMRTRIHR